MKSRRQTLVATLILATSLCLAPLQNSFAATAEEMLADGNRLFRYEGGRMFSDQTDAAGVREGRAPIQIKPGAIHLFSPESGARI